MNNDKRMVAPPDVKDVPFLHGKRNVKVQDNPGTQVRLMPVLWI